MSESFILQRNERIIDVENIVTVFYLEYGKDFVFAGESHDFWEFTYIDKGSVVFTADTREFLLRGGEIAFHKPNEFHKLRADGVPPNVSVASFVCRSEAMRFFENKIFRLSAAERDVLAKLIDEGRKAFSLCSLPPVMGMRENPDAPVAAKQLTFNLLEQFLITLLRRGDDAIVRERRHIARIERENYPKEMYEILQYLDRHIEEPLTVARIAEHFHMSENALKKYVARYIEGGVMQKFNDMKLERAKYLIREQDLNFTQIADFLGYSSVHYFSRLFHAKTGMTPSQYRDSITDRA